jgi:hypothetical protein
MLTLRGQQNDRGLLGDWVEKNRSGTVNTTRKKKRNQSLSKSAVP